MQVTSIEPGNMSNADEDWFPVDDYARDELAQGIADEVDKYFNGLSHGHEDSNEC